MATGTPATDALRRAGVWFALHTYAHDPRTTSYGLEAAAALGVEPERVFKTIIVSVPGVAAVGAAGSARGLGVVIVPVTTTVDLRAAATALGAKRIDLADPALAQRVTGYVVGGISPLGQRRALPTVIDETVDLWDTVLVSGGRRGLDVELSGGDLVRLTEARVAAIAR